MVDTAAEATQEAWSYLVGKKSREFVDEAVKAQNEACNQVKQAAATTTSYVIEKSGEVKEVAAEKASETGTGAFLSEKGSEAGTAMSEAKNDFVDKASNAMDEMQDMAARAGKVNAGAETANDGDVEAGNGSASNQGEASTNAAPLLSATPTPCSLSSSPSSSILGSTVAAERDSSTTSDVSTVSFRPLRSSDRHRIQQLHEEWFPVSYSDDFYDHLVNNHCLVTSGDQLFTCVATLNDTSKNVCEEEREDVHPYCRNVGEPSYPGQQRQQQKQMGCDDTIIGCAVGAFIHHTRLSAATAELLVPNSQQHPKLFYIMTLGTVKEYRNLGVATLLIQKISDLVEQDPSTGVSGCTKDLDTLGAESILGYFFSRFVAHRSILRQTVYLHVIPYNKGAIRLYEKLGYYQVSTIPNYYQIDHKNYDCYLYAKYYHGTTNRLCSHLH